MATLALATTTNPGFADWQNVNTLIEGLTIIPDGGTMAGIYKGLVICLGSATMTADVVVEADLWVKTNLTGIGRNLTVGGNLSVGGTLSLWDGLTDPNAPNQLFVSGNLNGNEFYANSMTIVGTTNVSNVRTYYATFVGDVSVYSSLNFSGVSSAFPDGGEVYAVNVSAVTITGSGIDVTSDDPTLRSGIGGSFIASGNIVAIMFFADGGDRYGAVPSNNTLDSPSGGVVEIQGTLRAFEVSVDGGSVLCTLGFQPHFPGAGGEIQVLSATRIDLATSTGGNTSTATTGNAGGVVDLRGSVNVGTINVNGGSSTDFTFAGDGGPGGSIDLYAGGYAISLFASGGSSLNGAFGGAGGQIDIRNMTNITSLTATGGGASAGTAGPGGSVYTYAGMTANTVNLSDGTGLTAPSASDITLFVAGGSVCVGSLNMANRSGCRIRGVSSVGFSPTTLQIKALTGAKSTLNQGASTSASIAAMIAGSTFICNNSTGNWYRLQGALLI